jgi:hypothetical protein
MRVRLSERETDMNVDESIIDRLDELTEMGDNIVATIRGSSMPASSFSIIRIGFFFAETRTDTNNVPLPRD